VIVRTHEGGQPFPVLGRLRRQQIVLIGHRPPDGAVRAQTRTTGMDIPIITVFPIAENPSGRTGEKDQVGLDS